MIALEALEVLLYLDDLRVIVARGDYLLGALNESALVVESVEQYGQFALEGNVVEAPFPVGLSAACAFGSNAEVEVLRLACLLGDDVRDAAVLFAINGDAPHAAEYRP